MTAMRIALAAAAAVLLAAGCASAPSPAAEPEARTVPDWVIAPPPGDARHEYFVASATDPVGDVAAAEEYATNSLIDEIVRYIGVTVTTETTAEARASLEQFETSVTQQVRQTGTARLSGFRVQDRFVDRRGDAVTAYILVAYERQALEAEKARIAALFRERREALDRPEREARQAEAAGDLFGAVAFYVEAAGAASRSDVENADIRFQNNMTAARRLVAGLRLEPLNGDRITEVGTAFAEPFRVRVIETSGGRPVAGVPLLVSYRELMPNQRMGVRSARITTDADGIAEFVHPPATVVGHETLTVSIDSSGLLRELETVARADRPAVDALREVLVNRRVVFRYRVVSRARTVPTGVIVLDADLVGNPIASRSTASGVETALSRADFDVRSVSFDAARLKDADQAALVAEWRERFGDAVDRIIFGVVAIDEFDESDGVIVRVSGTLQAVDLATATVVHSVTTFQRSRSNSASAAITAAFRNLGVKMGEEFVAQLR